MAVIAIALLAVERSAGLQVNTQAELQQRTLALWVADNVITRTRLQLTEVTAGRYQGSELMGPKEWHWELLVQASPDNWWLWVWGFLATLTLPYAHPKPGRADDRHWASIHSSPPWQDTEAQPTPNPLKIPFHILCLR